MKRDGFSYLFPLLFAPNFVCVCVVFSEEKKGSREGRWESRRREREIKPREREKRVRRERGIWQQPYKRKKRKIEKKKKKVKSDGEKEIIKGKI